MVANTVREKKKQRESESKVGEIIQIEKRKNLGVLVGKGM